MRKIADVFAGARAGARRRAGAGLAAMAATVAMLGSIAGGATAVADTTDADPAGTGVDTVTPGARGTLDAPAVRQTITKNEVASAAAGRKDAYTVDLSVTGRTTSDTTQTGGKAVIDVVFVLDTSGSMAERNRMETMAEAITGRDGLSSMLFGSPDRIDAQASVVSFSDDAKMHTTSPVTRKTDLDNAIRRLSARGSTHWEKGLEKVQDIKTREHAAKYMVFLTDGDPGKAGWSADRSDLKIYNEAVSAGKDLARQGWNILNVGVDMPDKAYVDPQADEVTSRSGWSWNRRDGYVSPLEALTARETAGKAATGETVQIIKAYPKTDVDELGEVFRELGQIITTVTTRSYGRVSITDTLSTWVEPQFSYDARSGVISSDITLLASDGSDVASQLRSATYDRKTRTVNVVLKDGFTLADGVTYTVRFTVRPSDAAYARYAANRQAGRAGYTDEDDVVRQGDADTGADSAGRDGFAATDEAHLSYAVCTAIDGTAQTCDAAADVAYARPVLQVKTGRIAVHKTWSPSAPDDATTVTFALHRDTADGDTIAERAAAGPDWTIAFDDLAPGTYVVTEHAVDGYDAASDGTTTRIGADDLWEASAADSTTGHPDQADNVRTYDVTVTNVRTTVVLPAGSITVGKTLTGRAWKDDDSFSFVIEADQPKTSPMPADDTVTIGKDTNGHTAGFGAIEYGVAGTYRYVVRESHDRAIAGMHYSDAVYEVSVVVEADPATGALAAPTVSVRRVAGDDGTRLDPAETMADRKATFTNAYVGTGALPLTGGTSAHDWLVYGGGLSLAALIAGVGVMAWRRRMAA